MGGHHRQRFSSVGESWGRSVVMASSFSTCSPCFRLCKAALPCRIRTGTCRTQRMGSVSGAPQRRAMPPNAEGTRLMQNAPAKPPGRQQRQEGMPVLEQTRLVFFTRQSGKARLLRHASAQGLCALQPSRRPSAHAVGRAFSHRKCSTGARPPAAWPQSRPRLPPASATVHAGPRGLGTCGRPPARRQA